MVRKEFYHFGRGCVNGEFLKGDTGKITTERVEERRLAVFNIGEGQMERLTKTYDNKYLKT